ncbi:MAG: trehalose-phosphatase [Phycisphaerae bacterium]
MKTLEQALESIACTPQLLVASDYDGTIAPIVTNPDEAFPLRETVVALRHLSELPNTKVAVISGRALRNLAQLVGLPDIVHLVGSHGSEFDLDFAHSLSPEAIELHKHLLAVLTPIADQHEGCFLETKPASIAFHYRNASPDDAEEALNAIETGPAKLAGVHIRRGKMVIEFSVVPTDKGNALESLRHHLGATAVLFVGDDKTDEDAFATMQGPDVAIKVGGGDTRASYRVSEPVDVARLLARLGDLRSKWLATAHAVPIEKHSMLSDQRTIALVTPDATINWTCMPRIDSSALFADLLGGPTAGYFRIGDAGGAAPASQKYLDDSLVLRTSWPEFTVTDFLDCTGGRPTQRAGRSDLIRIVEGAGRVKVEFAPRLDFGRVATNLIVSDGGLRIEGLQDSIVLRAPGVDWHIETQGDHEIARAEFDLGASGTQVFELCYGTGSLNGGVNNPAERLRRSKLFWSSWAEQLTPPPVERELVIRAALVLKGLCYGPTGAICAAGTTSLPETLGGIRNWDYRFCWLRDAAMSAAALVKLGSITEAMQYLSWLLDLVDVTESPERLRPLYGVTGEEVMSEAELGALSGYRGSRPVRVGNAAALQVQLDVFGPIVDLIALLVEHDAPLSSEHWRLVESMVHAVQLRWRDPDHGIWEVRRPKRHHVHSKVMCWVAVDRGVKIAQRFLHRDRSDWIALRDEIAHDILENGYKKSVNAFTAAYDDVDLDASALYVGLAGLLPAHDERFINTVSAVEKSLKSGPTVYRYRADDHLPGIEGGFHICTSWLIDALIRLGRVEDARALFDEQIKLAGHTGMLAEQYEPDLNVALGNVPQAYSHLGVIENAIQFARLQQQSDE